MNHENNKSSYLFFSLAWWAGWLLIASIMILFWDKISFFAKMILFFIELVAAPDIKDLKIFKDAIMNVFYRNKK